MAAPFNIWAGTTDNWGTAGNWTGIEPVDDDSVLIPEVSAQEIQTGLDNSGVDLDDLIVARGFLANIGASGNQLKLAADLIKFWGGGEFWFQTAQAAAEVTDELQVIAATPDIIVNLSDDGTSSITKAILHRGNITSSADITNLQAGFATNINTDLTLAITSGAGTLAALQQYGGVVTAANVITTVQKSAGTLIKTGTTAIATLWNLGGDTIYNSTGTLVTAHVVRGILDMTQTAKETTITDLWLYPDGQIKYDDKLTTITNLHVVREGI